MTQLGRFRRFCGDVLDLDLEPFQVRISREVFSDRRETLVLLPRGNGKSTLLAAIGLWHLLSANQPQVAIGAASRQQAGVLFDIARQVASPEPEDRHLGPVIEGDLRDRVRHRCKGRIPRVLTAVLLASALLSA